jgi:protein SERAC1
VTGLGGHAFRSFKAKDEDYMWLRDGLPRDMPNSRIFTYGYPTKVPGSKSFQSLEDLGLAFQRVLEHLAEDNKKVCGYASILIEC